MQGAGGTVGGGRGNNAAMVQGLFGGGKVDHDADHRQLLEQQSKRTISTRHDMHGATPATVMEMLDDDTKAEYQMIFQSLDEDGSGEITVNEMASAFRTMGLQLSNTEIKDLVLSVDQDSNGLIDVGEFALMLYQISTGTASKAHLHRVQFDTKKTPQKYCEKNCPNIDRRRKRVWACCDDPSSSSAAQYVSVFIMTLILISCTAFVWETDPNFHNRNSEFWDTLEAFCTGCFTIEYLCRILSTPNVITFLFDGMNTIDLVAIVPFYIELILVNQSGGSTNEGGFKASSLRAFRLFRVFRLFKIGRHVSWLQVFSDTYVASFPPLIMIIFVMSIIMVFIASLVHTFEAPIFDHQTKQWITHDGTLAVVQSIPDGFWYAVVTLTTVGYGDITLSPGIGQILAMFTSISGILVLAIPISVISLNFHDKYEANERRQHQRAESIIRLAELREEMERNKTRGAVTPIDGLTIPGSPASSIPSSPVLVVTSDNEPKKHHKRSKSIKNRPVVSLLHASSDRCILSMRKSGGDCLIAEEANRLDLRHEFKAMLEQWQPQQRRELLRRTKSIRDKLENGDDVDIEEAAEALLHV